MQELMQKYYIIAYSNTVLLFGYLCNLANIQMIKIFVSALIEYAGYFLLSMNKGTH